MPYIDRDKFLKSITSRFKCVPLISVPKTINGEECFDGEDLEQVLNQAPTEDVVPRAEVEKAKQEVAREIFEEIENCYVGMLEEADCTIEEATLEENHSLARTAKYGKDVMLLTFDTLRKMVKKKYIGE